MNSTYDVALSNIPQFDKLVANANKKAAKLGVPGFVVTKGEPRQVKFTERGVDRFVNMVSVTIDGTTPKYNGWKLVGVITPLGTDAGVVVPFVTTVPGETLKTAGESRDPLACDYCKVRRDRNETFIVQHDDGTERQVGRSCLTDFLGDARMSPAGLAGLMNTLAGISDSVAKWHKGPRQFDSDSLAMVVACTLSVMRANSWVSVSEAKQTGKTPTRTYVSDVMLAVYSKPEVMEGKDFNSWKIQYGIATEWVPTEADFTKAVEYIDNASMILESKTEQNSYLDALRLITSFNAVNRKALGIACSLVAMVNRELGIETNPLKAKLLAAFKTSEFVGEIKKRQGFTATLVETKTIQGAYESFILNTFVDGNGNIVKCFGSVPFTLGETAQFKATPTRHDTYGQTKSTVVNRLAKA